MKNNLLTQNDGKTRLVRHLSPIAVWALAFGCSVGWGSFVMPGTTFLPLAGPVGTTIGIAVGAAIMVVVGINYFFLMKRYPDAGGTFSYTKNIFGYDHGFLASWFMILVYLAITWANSTALPLIFRNIFGNLLQFGKMYSIAGYDVYLGEVLLSLAAILLFGFVCLRGGKVASIVQVLMAFVLIAGVIVGVGMVFFGTGSGSPDEVLNEINEQNMPSLGPLFIVFLAPWAFAGFESVSHSVEEYRFPVKKVLKVMIISLVTAAAAYIGLVLIASVNTPSEYSSLGEYLENIGNLGPIKGMPVLNSIYTAVGVPGLIVIGLAAAAGIITGLLGNMVAGSRLIYSLAHEKMIPEKMGVLNKFGVPKNAVLFLILVSLPIPFLGRSAIGWVVDINTIGITIAYIYTSAAAFKEAIKAKSTAVKITGLIGIVISSFFLVYFLFPIEWSVSQLSTESYFMLLIWILIGFFAFYMVFNKEKKAGTYRIGKSTVVWIVLLSLIFSTSIIWVNKSSGIATDSVIEEISKIDEEIYANDGMELTEAEKAEKKAVVEKGFDSITQNIIRNMIFLFVLVIVSLLIIFNIYRSIQRSHMSAVKDKTMAEESSQAKTTFLSNMSHDIRTPMNAIVGYVALAKQEKDLPPTVSDYLTKIESSSGHLLSLINDVLEMSRIESGKMELAPVSSDMRKIMDELKNMFATQMATKGVYYDVICEGIVDPFVLCDANRFNRVLLNLVSNAYKFTPKDGSVTVTLTQTGRDNDNAQFRLSVKDTGIGMSPEFVKKVFEAYERERTSTVENIQGTGLGTAITKSIVDLMGGEISVTSEQGKGSEFVVNVAFPIDKSIVEETVEQTQTTGESEFTGMRLLLVEDNEENKDVAKNLFERVGFVIDTAVNGEDAVEMIAGSKPGTYRAVIMDIEMPVKDGYQATALIRSLKNPALSKIPIVALTAKAFSEDIAAAYKSGMNAYISKPISIATIKTVMAQALTTK